jgi:hypothetical protein
MALQTRHWSIAGKYDIRIVARFKMRFDIWFLFRVGRSHSICSSLCSFESVGDCEGNVLTIVTNYVVFKWGSTLEIHSIESRSGSRAKYFSDIRTMKNSAYVRHFLCRGCIERQ